MPEYGSTGETSETSSSGRVSFFGRLLRIILPRPTYPNGRVTVQDGRLGQVPVPGVQVRVIHWGNIVSGTTDSNGNYRINAGFFVGTHAHVLFEDNRTIIKPFDTSSLGSHVEFVLRSLITGAVHMDGWKSKSDLNGMNIHFSANNQARYWALIKRSVDRYYNYCGQTAVGLPPGKLTLYAHWAKSSGPSSAPMLSYVTGTDYNSALPQFLQDNGFSVGSVIAAVTSVLPDITIRQSAYSTINSTFITSVVFHELAHASHYRNVGQWFWTNYIAYIVANGPYGNVNSPGSGRVALSEAWAEYVARNFANRYYGANTENEENVHAGTTFDEWIPYGVFFDMTDVNTPTSVEPSLTINGNFFQVTDNVNGYTASQYYSVLTSNIADPVAYRNSFISRHGSAQSIAITTLFNSYGY